MLCRRTTAPVKRRSVAAGYEGAHGCRANEQVRIRNEHRENGEVSNGHVALMRGINVGGKNKLPMKELRALFEELGCGSVASYIQSGNVVFEAGIELAEQLPAILPSHIEARFGLRVPVVIRSAQALREAAERNPFLSEGCDTQHLHVGFLASRPDAKAVASLDASRSDIDRFEVLGEEVHLHVPGGMARTKLTTDYFDRRLGTPMTVRNWRTVQKLIEMTA